MNLQTLRQLGFDESRHIPFSHPSAYRVRCSQCEAVCVNGVPTHEQGCPHAVQECRGCSAVIPSSRFQKYCEDCR